MTLLRCIFGVLSADEDTTPEQELTEELLAILTSFAGRLYGVRSRKKADWSNVQSR